MSKLDKVRKYVEKGKVDKLIAIANGKDKETRVAAVEGLGQLISDEKALNTLVAMIDDQDADIRKAVVDAIGRSEGSYVETRLQYCISHEKDEKVLEAAKESLTKVRNKK